MGRSGRGLNRMRLALDRVVPFPRDSVFAWWTDFREDDHQHPNSPARSTRLILRRSGKKIGSGDRSTRPAPVTIDEHVTLNPPTGYSVAARYPGADVRYAYRFSAEGDGTQVTLDVDIRPRHIGRILVPVAAAWWRRYTERDLDFHLRAMATDLSASASASRVAIGRRRSPLPPGRACDTPRRLSGEGPPAPARLGCPRGRRDLSRASSSDSERTHRNSHSLRLAVES